jgi:hypothetical protein
MNHRSLTLTFCLALLLLVSQAQLTNDLNSILPVDLADDRGKITRSVMGMDFMVRIFLAEGIKNVDACSGADYGKLTVEIDWYDKNSELGKSQIDMIAMLKADEQQKADFLGKGPYEDLNGGSLVIESTTAECINTISGATGKMEHHTSAKFFIYSDGALVKISYDGKVKSETVKGFISAAAAEIKDFDFARYKNVTATEKG